MACDVSPVAMFSLESLVFALIAFLALIALLALIARKAAVNIWSTNASSSFLSLFFNLLLSYWFIYQENGEKVEVDVSANPALSFNPIQHATACSHHKKRSLKYPMLQKQGGRRILKLFGHYPFDHGVPLLFFEAILQHTLCKV